MDYQYNKMNSEGTGSFIAGLAVGTVVALTGGYFVGTVVLRRTLREHDLERSRTSHTRRMHLQRAQEILDAPNGSDTSDDGRDEPVVLEQLPSTDNDGCSGCESK